MQHDKIVVEFSKGRMLLDAKKGGKRVYEYAVACALELDGIVRAATPEEILEDGWE